MGKTLPMLTIITLSVEILKGVATVNLNANTELVSLAKSAALRAVLKLCFHENFATTCRAELGVLEGCPKNCPDG
jgi:hypothetical protein